MMDPIHAYPDDVFTIHCQPEESVYSINFPDCTAILNSGTILSKAFRTRCP